MTPYLLLRDLLALLGVIALAWAFHLYARVLPSLAVAACWVIFALLITAGLWRQSRVRRRAFLAVWIVAESPLQRWLKGGLLMGVRAVLPACSLALVLMLALTRAEDVRMWLALMGGAAALVLLRAWLHARLGTHVNPVYLPVLSWRLSAFVIGAGLVVVLLLLALHREHPDFAAVSLERAVWHMADHEIARSAGWQVLLQAMAAVDGLRFWLAQQLMPTPGTSLLHLLGWLLVLAEEVLFVWSYLLMGYGVLTGVGAHDRRV